MLSPFLESNRLEAGCDEVGRGCLCGPVVAAAVILPESFANELVNDSKKLKKQDRTALVTEIKLEAIAWAVAEASVEEIDQINILNASFLAMNRAVQALQTQPEHLLIDGNRFKTTLNIPFDCIIKGDGKYASIAAASILAKVYRDEMMAELAEQFPGYGWEKNVGYPTKAHRDGIRKHGLTPLHRKTFKHLPEQLKMEF
ncbi:Ribonuclease HII [Indibacter alkaliphilus LW1]|uniref:Ribonuclease HII n=1 Tax=Indibacter alkaliphilus (strain CCUG 57479 / KCTC 22604 / LW1) TaxID=1189612 RepID=S2DA65_INDAL|nr:ribonuclease HII [Indibacter alkaliphilus]EOZ95819.1 Ribonuclease HII [Indibacter alkaliphilus LW1]